MRVYCDITSLCHQFIRCVTDISVSMTTTHVALWTRPVVTGCSQPCKQSDVLPWLPNHWKAAASVMSCDVIICQIWLEQNGQSDGCCCLVLWCAVVQRVN